MQGQALPHMELLGCARLYSGQRSWVISAVDRSGQKLAVKAYIRAALPPDAASKVKREYEILAGVSHSHIVRALGSWDDDKHLYVASELGERGDLLDIAARFRRSCIPERAVALKVGKPILEALSYLHDRGIIHRDLKPENVVVTADGVSKLCDFGLAIDTSRPGEVPVSRVGTTEFMAPEITRLRASMSSVEKEWLRRHGRAQYCPKVDVWSLGVLLAELLFGSGPFAEGDRERKEREILAEGPVPLPARSRAGDAPSPLAFDFLQTAMARSPEDRPTAAELLAHGWLSMDLSAAAARPPACSAQAPPQADRQPQAQQAPPASPPRPPPLRLASSCGPQTPAAAASPLSPLETGDESPLCSSAALTPSPSWKEMSTAFVGPGEAEEESGSCDGAGGSVGGASGRGARGGPQQAAAAPPGRQGLKRQAHGMSQASLVLLARRGSAAALHLSASAAPSPLAPSSSAQRRLSQVARLGRSAGSVIELEPPPPLSRGSPPAPSTPRQGYWGGLRAFLRHTAAARSGAPRRAGSETLVAADPSPPREERPRLPPTPPARGQLVHAHSGAASMPELRVRLTTCPSSGSASALGLMSVELDGPEASSPAAAGGTCPPSRPGTPPRGPSAVWRRRSVNAIEPLPPAEGEDGGARCAAGGSSPRHQQRSEQLLAGALVTSQAPAACPPPPQPQAPPAAPLCEVAAPGAAAPHKGAVSRMRALVTRVLWRSSAGPRFSPAAAPRPSAAGCFASSPRAAAAAGGAGICAAVHPHLHRLPERRA